LGNGNNYILRFCSLLYGSKNLWHGLKDKTKKNNKKKKKLKKKAFFFLYTIDMQVSGI
jgi:hypothetical protein